MTETIAQRIQHDINGLKEHPYSDEPSKERIGKVLHGIEATAGYAVSKGKAEIKNTPNSTRIDIYGPGDRNALAARLTVQKFGSDKVKYSYFKDHNGDGRISAGEKVFQRIVSTKDGYALIDGDSKTTETEGMKAAADENIAEAQELVNKAMRSKDYVFRALKRNAQEIGRDGALNDFLVNKSFFAAQTKYKKAFAKWQKKENERLRLEEEGRSNADVTRRQNRLLEKNPALKKFISDYKAIVKNTYLEGSIYSLEEVDGLDGAMSQLREVRASLERGVDRARKNAHDSNLHKYYNEDVFRYRSFIEQHNIDPSQLNGAEDLQPSRQKDRMKYFDDQSEIFKKQMLP